MQVAQRLEFQASQRMQVFEMWLLCNSFIDVAFFSTEEKENGEMSFKHPFTIVPRKNPDCGLRDNEKTRPPTREHSGDNRTSCGSPSMIRQKGFSLGAICKLNMGRPLRCVSTSIEHGGHYPDCRDEGEAFLF